MFINGVGDDIGISASILVAIGSKVGMFAISLLKSGLLLSGKPLVKTKLILGANTRLISIGFRFKRPVGSRFSRRARK